MAKRCAQCGKFFTPRSNDQVFCSQECGYRSDDKVLIRWKQMGALIEDGVATIRHKGDEDITDIENVEGSIASGKVELLDKDVTQIPEDLNVESV